MKQRRRPQTSVRVWGLFFLKKCFCIYLMKNFAAHTLMDGCWHYTTHLKKPSSRRPSLKNLTHGKPWNKISQMLIPHTASNGAWIAIVASIFRMLFPRFVTATVAFELAVAAARVGSSTLTAAKFMECRSEFSRSLNPNLDPVLSSTPERASFSPKTVSRCCNNNAGGAVVVVSWLQNSACCFHSVSF
jgi:hypothetical protein